MAIGGSGLFTGQPISAAGVNSGSPLVDNNGALGFGLYNHEVNSSTPVAIGTTSGVIDSCTVTPVSGTYLVIFSCNVTASSAAGNTLQVELSLGGTAQADTLRQATPIENEFISAFQYMSLAFNKIVTVNGSQAIAVNAVSSAGTVTVTGLNFDVVRIA